MIAAAVLLSLASAGSPVALASGFDSPIRIHAAAASASPGVDEAITYQINERHDGWQVNDTLAPPLRQAWAVTFRPNELVSYPVVAGGRVFVVVAHDINANPPYANYGERLFALDQATGAVLWGPVELGGTYSFGGATYDNGRLFAVNLDGLVRAFDPATGALLWQHYAPAGVDSAPVAVNGTIYLSLEGSDVPVGWGNQPGWAALAAMSEGDGSLLWNYDVNSGFKSSPAVDNGEVLGDYACEQVYALTTSGSFLWHDASPWHGGGGLTGVIHDGAYYARDSCRTFPAEILDGKTGSVLGHFDSFFAPAFTGKTGFFTPRESVNGPLVLRAEELPSMTPLWTFSGDGQLITAPVGANGYVYIGSNSGNVYAVHASSGQQAWMANAGAPVGGPTESNETVMPGLAIAGGMLFVPASNRLVAFAPSPRDRTWFQPRSSSPVSAPTGRGWWRNRYR